MIEETASLMREFETASETTIPTTLWCVVRLDGRGFTALTKTGDEFEKPFDIRFRNYMVETSKRLMECGFDMPMVFTQSDEISVVISPNCSAFGRRAQKTTTVLAGEASAIFTSSAGRIGVFDARLLALPSKSAVIDYLIWRQEDAGRNALSAQAYWALRRDGKTARQATQRLTGASVSDKNELLFDYGINFDALPLWQKRGVLIDWEIYEKEGFNPITSESVVAQRRRIRVDDELPMRDGFRRYVETRLVS